MSDDTKKASEALEAYELKAENARLKAECQRLHDKYDLQRIVQEREQLKAENERLLTLLRHAGECGHGRLVMEIEQLKKELEAALK
jgi:hypothetical protein